MLDTVFVKILFLDVVFIQKASYLHTTVLDEVMKFFTILGDFGAIWIIIIGVYYTIKKYRFKAYLLIEGICINMLLGEGLLKHFFHRARPFDSIDTIQLLIPPPLTSSFPSGHTSASIVFAILFSWLFWRQNRLVVGIIWILALGISFSRFYLQVHYPSDILVGALLGCMSAGVVIFTSRYFQALNKQ